MLWNTTFVGGGSVQYKLRRKLLSQNFLYSRTLVNSLVRNSSLGPNDLILEIGPGKGLITTELLKVSKRVVAVELDHQLSAHIKKFLGQSPNLELYNLDFLDYPLPKEPYKVFANLPFSIEGEIVRKLLDSQNPPVDCYIVVMKELALRLSGIPHENQFSLKHKPWFDFSLYFHFKRSDFIPNPSVDCVMWRINKREIPLVLAGEKGDWEKLIEVGFGNGTPVKQNLRKILIMEELNYLTGKLNFSLKIKPSYLSFKQWLQVYQVIQNIKRNNF